MNIYIYIYMYICLYKQMNNVYTYIYIYVHISIYLSFQARKKYQQVSGKRGLRNLRSAPLKNTLPISNSPPY